MNDGSIQYGLEPYERQLRMMRSFQPLRFHAHPTFANIWQHLAFNGSLVLRRLRLDEAMLQLFQVVRLAQTRV